MTVKTTSNGFDDFSKKETQNKKINKNISELNPRTQRPASSNKKYFTLDWICPYIHVVAKYDTRPGSYDLNLFSAWALPGALWYSRFVDLSAAWHWYNYSSYYRKRLVFKTNECCYVLPLKNIRNATILWHDKLELVCKILNLCHLLLPSLLWPFWSPNFIKDN